MSVNTKQRPKEISKAIKRFTRLAIFSSAKSFIVNTHLEHFKLSRDTMQKFILIVRQAINVIAATKCLRKAAYWASISFEIMAFNWHQDIQGSSTNRISMDSTDFKRRELRTWRKFHKRSQHRLTTMPKLKLTRLKTFRFRKIFQRQSTSSWRKSFDQLKWTRQHTQSLAMTQRKTQRTSTTLQLLRITRKSSKRENSMRLKTEFCNKNFSCS